MMFLDKLRNLPRLLDELRVVAIGLRDPRTGWFPRLVGILLLAYLLSPVDLIPDVIPVLGLLDDLVLLPIGLGIIKRLLKAEVLADARERVAAKPTKATVSKIASIIVIAFVVLVWLVVLVVAIAILSGNGAKKNTEESSVSSESGAKEIRTPDLIIANDALYQLSYRPIGST